MLLEAWRREREWSKTRAARAVSVSLSMYARIERGDRLPGRAVANRIARVAHVLADAWDQEDGR